MDGPGAFLRDHFEDVLSLLGQRDLSPEVHLGTAERLPVREESVHLVVTSPPYPLIEMWDEQLASLTGRGVSDPAFFDACHDLLGRAWDECRRVLVPGGILAINVGDATRRLGGSFRLYANHVAVTARCEALGFETLVPILWKKPTNKPNAFLGSGFLPPNAYVTLDCEHILLFRKGGLRALPPKDPLRYASEFSKAERDVWFSQIWEVRGAPQIGPRSRGVAPFPEEIPRRLIRMFSCLGDVVLDPFAGEGTTLRVARSLGRKGIGVEISPALAPALAALVREGPPDLHEVLESLMSSGPASRDGGRAKVSPTGALGALEGEPGDAPRTGPRAAAGAQLQAGEGQPY